MKTKDDFIEFYNTYYRNIINKTYQEYLAKYNKKKKKSILEISLMLVLLLFSYFLYYKEYLDFSIMLVILLFFGKPPTSDRVDPTRPTGRSHRPAPLLFPVPFPYFSPSRKSRLWHP